MLGEKIMSKLGDFLNITKSEPDKRGRTYDQALDKVGKGSTVSAERMSIAHACVAKIVAGMIQMPVNRVTMQGNSFTTMEPDATWYKLNKRPNRYWNHAVYMDWVLRNLNFRGDAIVLIDRDQFYRPREFVPIPWHKCKPEIVAGEVRYFVNWPEIGISTWFATEEVLHFSGMGFDGLRSMSVISYAQQNINNMSAMDQYTGNVFANGANPSAVLETTGKMDEPEIEKLQNTFARKYSGLDQAKKLPLILTGGMKLARVSMSPVDADLIKSKDWELSAICRAFGVPGHLVGLPMAASGLAKSNEAENQNFRNWGLSFWASSMEQEIGHKLSPNNTRETWLYDRDALIEADTAAQAAYYRAALGGPGSGAGWMSQNDVRRRKRLPVGDTEMDRIFYPVINDK